MVWTKYSCKETSVVRPTNDKKLNLHGEKKPFEKTANKKC